MDNVIYHNFKQTNNNLGFKIECEILFMDDNIVLLKNNITIGQQIDSYYQLIKLNT